MDQKMVVNFMTEPVVNIEIVPDWVEFPFGEPLNLTVELATDVSSKVMFAPPLVVWRGAPPAGTSVHLQDEKIEIKMPGTLNTSGGIAHGFFIMFEYNGLKFSSPDPTVINGGTGQSP